ncbi:MAG: hypothetical protein ACE5KX_05745 [Acidimicrobiia bacterium]
MLASIHPLGERARHNRWGITATAYLAGSVAGGAALGTMLGLLGEALSGLAEPDRALTAVLIGGVCVVGAAFDLRLGSLRLPTLRRQVNEDWLNQYRGWVYGVGFGFQLGLGVVTIVSSAAIYVTFILAFLSASTAAGLVVGTAFGLARAAVIFTVAVVRDPGDLRAVHRRFQRWGPLAHRAAVGMQMLIVIGAAAAAVTG